MAVWCADGVIDGYVAAARAFCEENLLGVLAVEYRVFSDRFNYAGTVDLMARSRSGKVVMVDWKTSNYLYHHRPAGIIGGAHVMVDWKTSNYRYPDNALQLAAYAGADWMIDGGGIVREVAFPSAAAVALLEQSGKYEARFLSRAKLAEHHALFTWLLDIKDFLGSANEAWNDSREGGAAG